MPFYDKAMFMLGTTPVPKLYKEDFVLKEIADEMGRGDTFKKVNVGVYFGDTSTPIDPYFNGDGPLRTGCTNCAGCMVGCRYDFWTTIQSRSFILFQVLQFFQKSNKFLKVEELFFQLEFWVQ